MFDLSLPPILAPALATGPVVAEDDAKAGDAVDAFAALLGAAGIAVTAPAARSSTAPDAGLPKSGKDLPDDTDSPPEADEEAPGSPWPDPVSKLPPLSPGLVAGAPPIARATSEASAEAEPAKFSRQDAKAAVMAASHRPRVQLDPHNAVSDGAPPLPQPSDAPSEVLDGHPAAKLALAPPIQAALRAASGRDGDLVEPAIRPEPAPAARAPVVSPATLDVEANLPPTVIPLAGGSDPLPAPDGAQAAPPSPARADFAAVVDRLIEARDLAGARPATLSLRHDDFGAVSLRFHAGDGGLSVTMASPDPDFARAVNAAIPTGATAGQSDAPRPGADSAAHRHAASTAHDDQPRQSRAAPQASQRDERPRADEPLRHREPTRHRGGIFA